MNGKTRIIIDELIKLGLITSVNDLTAGDSTNFIFDYMVQNYSFLLANDVSTALPESYFKQGKIIHELIVRYGKYFLKNPQIIENRFELLKGDHDIFPGEDRDKFKKKIQLPNEPVIFVANHAFKDDVLATVLAAERRGFIIFGSLPQFYGTLDGFLSAKNGVAVVNRKVASSREASVEKGKYVLSNGIDLIICTEGVWNKSPNMLMLDFWRGFYIMAQKPDGTFRPIVPIIHYICNTHKPGKDNPIHTIVDDPIILDGMSEEEGIEYIRTKMLTWYWKLMEKFGQTTRIQLLDGFENANEAWEDELRKRIATADKYDYEIEICADRRRKNGPLSVWEPIANLPITKANAIEVVNARQLVKTLRENDYQHRF